MGETNWTQAQAQAIEAEGTNILVSAAAGSGKTAVLVERVIRMITRDENPLDIDRLIIVTFTRAAAAQMKTKIYRAIKEKLIEAPEDHRLSQQLIKVQSAKICTIDSLCSSIVRENIQDVDLDPGFRIADEAVLKIMKRDVLKNMLEECYNEASESFMDLVQYYTDKNDNKLEEIILTLYEFSQSHPEPYAWLRSCAYPYKEAQNMSSGEEFVYPEGSKNWIMELGEVINSRFGEILNMAREGLRITEMSSGPWQYEDIFKGITDFILSLDEQSFDFRVYAIKSFLNDWQQLPRISKNDEVNDDLKLAAMEIRKEIKKQLEDLRDNYLYDDLETIYADMAQCAGVADTVSGLVIRFSKEFDQAKKRRNYADFSDIAHGALRVLIEYNDNDEIVRDDSGNPVYTKTADMMASSIDQVIVDEYQDTNMLQEYLVKALSGERFGKPDVFMVGDVKQSIYGFRMACPDLFNEKLDGYTGENDTDNTARGRKIILDRNFRSRKEILDFTNLIFRQTMVRDIGGIDYSDGHALEYGGVYGPGEEAGDSTFIPEIMFLEAGAEQAKYLEGYMIAGKIEELIANGSCRYSDIVILTRTSDNPQLERILFERGIPVLKTSSQGFFASFEIRLFSDLLSIIDNPYQDIPFAAVLYSPLCCIGTDELARIHIGADEGESFYEQFVRYCDDGHEDCAEFLLNLKKWRRMSMMMGLNDFLDYILDDSGFANMAAAMPQGADRTANLELFKAKAAEFSKGSFTGLFEFLRYLENMKESGMDFGNRTSAYESDDAVRMMTIHRSKGLEFPVVIVAACGKKYNATDLNSSIIPDRTFGVGLEKRDPENRMIRKTAFMQMIRYKKNVDLYAEEMRLLYVALTRAREKLIITGTDRQLSSKIKKWDQNNILSGRTLEPFRILNAGSFLSLMGAALNRFKDTDPGFVLEYADDLDIEESRVSEIIMSNEAKEKLLCVEEDLDISGLTGMIDYQYPYLKAASMMGKITASQLENKDIKGADYIVNDREPVFYQEESEENDFRDSDRLSGAERGNAYHRFLELTDYSDDINEQLRSFVSRGLMSREYAGTIDIGAIECFYESCVGTRMKDAFSRNDLFREKQFVMGYEEDINSAQTITGNDFRSDAVDNELLLVQGITDAWFFENDNDGNRYIVLVDYKTDKVANEQYYKDKYTPQLKAYADALEGATGFKVAEKIVYSFELGREILLDI